MQDFVAGLLGCWYTTSVSLHLREHGSPERRFPGIFCSYLAEIELGNYQCNVILLVLGDFLTAATPHDGDMRKRVLVFLS